MMSLSGATEQTGAPTSLSHPPLCGALSIDDVPSDSPSDLSDDVFLADMDDEVSAKVLTEMQKDIERHIDAMKERIPVQIKVRKKSGLGISELDRTYKFDTIASETS